MPLLIHQHLSVFRHALHADVHLLAGRVVEELHLRLALRIRLHVRVPVDGAAEVCHRRDDAVVLHLERGRLVEALEVGAAKSLLALGGINETVIHIYIYMIIRVIHIISDLIREPIQLSKGIRESFIENHVDRFHFIQPSTYCFPFVIIMNNIDTLPSIRNKVILCSIVVEIDFARNE